MEFTVYHSPGKILKADHGQFVYVDQLSKDYKEFTSYSAKNYLYTNYNLTLPEYYNIVVYGDRNKVMLCPNCGKNSMRFNGLTKGWSIYCNQSCITSFRLSEESKLGINPFQNSEFIENNRIKVSKFQKSKMNDGSSPLLSKSSQLMAAKNNFIKNHINDTCYFYICRLRDLDKIYKIGICSTNVKSRLYYRGHKMYNHHILVKGSADKIAEIEYLVKLNLCENLSEIIPDNKIKLLFEIIRNY